MADHEPAPVVGERDVHVGAPLPAEATEQATREGEDRGVTDLPRQDDGIPPRGEATTARHPPTVGA